MKWEWSEDGDDTVLQMWQLMKRLSEDRRVVYSKWYAGRATFFSRELFCALLHFSQKSDDRLSRVSVQLLEALESDSPLSTKQLKALTELRGRDFEPEYNRGMKELFKKFLIVGCGEVEDGAFPSLAVGATRLIYEDLWEQAKSLTDAQAMKIVNQILPTGSLMRKFWERTSKSSSSPVGIFKK